ncbi:ROK family protein [Nonomuraea sp. SYSU D8015]|uniref:ROK family protein n=1 Tax=Nonomuraea sp. SYSU D8015 TaxID=2593644 RepID=UPI001660EA3B|nr:ROK family protein [Nonomuraea sp. SYSU D8015]
MILAIDVGGTKMAAGLVTHDGTVARSARVATPQGADAETLWKTLAALVEPLAEGVDGVGVGCGGPMAWPGGEVSPLNIPGWRGFPLRARLAGRFPGLPVRLHNDAICLAVAEHWKGAGQGSADMLGMVVSTGVGGGLILDGRLVNGGTGNAGHIGHVVVEPEGGPRCGCGGHGCLEAVARGPALTSWALSQGWIPSTTSSPEPAPISPAPAATARAVAEAEAGGAAPTATLQAAPGTAPHSGSPLAAHAMPGAAPQPAPGSEVRGEAEVQDDGAYRGEGVYQDDEAYREDRPVTARMLAADARAGDPAAVRAMRRAGRALGIAIASATHLCDLDVVTIGGGLSQAGEPLFGPLDEALREHARMGFARRVKVVPAALGQEAGLIGAAALILAGESYWTPARDH